MIPFLLHPLTSSWCPINIMKGAGSLAPPSNPSVLCCSPCLHWISWHMGIEKILENMWTGGQWQDGATEHYSCHSLISQSISSPRQCSTWCRHQSPPNCYWFCDMNVFFTNCFNNNSQFYFLRFRLKSHNKGFRRHKLVLPTGTSFPTVQAAQVLISSSICEDYLNEDEDDGSLATICHTLDCKSKR